jgi:3-methyladenine DNA glycosylase AlkD
MNKLAELKKELKEIADPRKAKLLQGYFKTGRGEYGEGDIFLGIQVPQLRNLVKTYKILSLADVEKLLHSRLHEERLLALFILVHKFNKTDLRSNVLKNVGIKKEIYNLYLRNTKWINNWDLVDLSAHEIVGKYLLDKNCLILTKLARSKNLWERRIAVLSSFRFIKNNKLTEALDLAEILLRDKHDLMHKAVGWMLREIGKRDLKTEIGFLDKHYRKMPRTMLRYAIEKFPEKLRMLYLKGK